MAAAWRSSSRTELERILKHHQGTHVRVGCAEHEAAPPSFKLIWRQLDHAATRPHEPAIGQIGTCSNDEPMGISNSLSRLARKRSW